MKLLTSSGNGSIPLPKLSSFGPRTISVPHTGTTTTHQLTRWMGWSPTGAHTQLSKMQAIWDIYQAGHKILIPRRDPALVYISHYQRRDPDKDPQLCLQYMLEFYALMRWVRAVVPHMIIEVDQGPPEFDALKTYCQFEDERDEGVRAFLAEWPKLNSREYKYEGEAPTVPNVVVDLRAEWGY